MIPITVLLENSTAKAGLLHAHGLSIIIHTNEQDVLLDTGPNSFFIKNAQLMNVNLDKVETLLLSHAHYDHTGGLKAFCKINEHAQIVMENTNGDKYYHLYPRLKKFIGLKAPRKIYKKIRKLVNPAQITCDSWFIPYTVSSYGKPSKNQGLVKKTRTGFVKDNFSHEGIYVIDDQGQLVIFNSCSHGGVINAIESARDFFPNKRVRSYIGGFHFPYKKGEEIHPEDIRNLEELIDYAKLQPEIKFYTGHCTGLPVIDYLKNALGKDRINYLQTGLSFSV
ncbi:MAG: MBL fold metallo-hydrolase [Treponemataceae bacterium]|nr:MBL fold metallo-hydrolase [Treponemataceae bacterium]